MVCVCLSFLSTKEDQFSVSIQPAVGELLMASTMTEQDFCKEQGELLCDSKIIVERSKSVSCFSVLLAEMKQGV